MRKQRQSFGWCVRRSRLPWRKRPMRCRGQILEAPGGNWGLEVDLWSKGWSQGGSGSPNEILLPPPYWNVWGGRGAFRSLRSPGHCMGSGRGGGIAGTGEVADGAEAMAVWFDHFLEEISMVWSFSCSESLMGSRVFWEVTSTCVPSKAKRGKR